MYHTYMVHGVVAVLQEVLHQEKLPMENPTIILEPVNHVANVVQNTQQKLATQLQQVQTMTQEI